MNGTLTRADPDRSALRAVGWDAPALRVRIRKRIPIAAGMGGGSADAAAMLRLAPRLAPVTDETLAAIAVGLGADVPGQLRPGLGLVDLGLVAGLLDVGVADRLGLARVGLGLAYITLFATELFGSRSGLGFLIGLAESGRRFDTMYVAIICIGLAGFLSDRLLIWLRARLLHGVSLGKEEQVGA